MAQEIKHRELITNVAKQTGAEPKNKDIAKILGLSQEAIRSRSYRNAKYKDEEVERIEEHYDIDLSNQTLIEDIDNDSDVLVDYFPEALASCGGGAFELSSIREKLRIPKICIKDYLPLAKYSVVNAYGDSMYPTIQNSDKLIVELGCAQINDNNIYIFCYEGKIFCKRLIQNIDTVVVISDNPDKSIYPTSVIEKENMNNIHLIGRIVGFMRCL